MAISSAHIRAGSLDAFYEHVKRPENAGKTFEFINAEIIEVSPSRTYNSWLSNVLVYAILSYCRAKDLPVYTSTGDGAYLIEGRVIVPDFAYKRTPMSRDYPDSVPPLSAVEIISPTDEPALIRNKRLIYQQAGILYWEVFPEEKSIDIYQPGKPTRTVGIEGSLDGANVIDGFTLPVRELFAE